MSFKKGKEIIEYRNYYLPSHFPLVFLSGAKWKISDIPSERLHFHNCLEIGICHSGSGTLRFCNGQEIHFFAGDITCIPRNTPHTTFSDPGANSRWSYLFFDPRQLFIDLLQPNSPLFFLQEDVKKYIIPAQPSTNISFLAQASIQELSLPSANPILVRSYLFTLFTEIMHFQSKQPVPTAMEKETRRTAGSNILRVAPALDYIEDHYMNQFSMETLANLCHISLTHFRRIFQEVMGISPLHYLNSVRITKACELLTNTNRTILDIAEATGFSSLSNFHRQFSQMVHLTPSEYRKQVLSGNPEGQNPSIIRYTGWMEP